MTVQSVMTAFKATVTDDEGVDEPGGLVTQRYPAIGRDVELSRKELRESGMLDLKLHLDREAAGLRRRAAPLRIEKA
jgi:hypothetical protein